MAYDAFISYRHGADGEVAAALERGLERLARPWNKLRAMSVFRDQSDLAAASDLTSTITSALDDTRYLVLLASRDSAASPWVDKEVAYWCDTVAGTERLIVVVTDGELRWDEAAGALSAGSDAVSPAVRSRIVTEPLFVDLRWARDAPELSLRDSRFRSAAVAVAAAIRGVAPSDLEGEDVRLHRRARRWARAAVASVVVLALAASVAAVLAVANAQRADRRARDALARQLGLAALDLPASDVDQAFLLSLVAAGLDSDDSAERFHAGRALIGRYARLDRLLHAPPGTTSIRGVAISPTDGRIVATVAGDDGSTRLLTWRGDRRDEPLITEMEGFIDASVAMLADGRALVGATSQAVLVDAAGASSTVPSSRVLLVDAATGIAVVGRPTPTVDVIDLRHGAPVVTGVAASGFVDLGHGRVAAASGSRVTVIDVATRAVTGADHPSAATVAVAAGPGGAVEALTATADALVPWSLDGGRLVAGQGVAVPPSAGTPRELVVSPDGRHALVVGAAGSAVVRLDTGEVGGEDPGATGIVSVDPSGRYAAVGGRRLTIWDLDAGRARFVAPRPVNAMAWSGCTDQTGCAVATIGESLDVWDAVTRRHVELVGQTNAQAVAITADGATVVTAGWGSTVAVWHTRPVVDTAARTAIEPADAGVVADVPDDCTTDLQAVSPQGELVVGHRIDDGLTTVCSVDDGSVLARARIAARSTPVASVAVDDDGAVALGGGGFVEYFRRDGDRFLTGSAIVVRIGDEPVDVTALAVRDGTVAAGVDPAAADAVARLFLWPAGDGGTPSQFETDHRRIPAIALLGPSAEHVVVAGRDGSDGPLVLQVWETSTGRRQGRALGGLHGDVLALGGDRAAVLGADRTGATYRWELDTDPTGEICAIVGRPLGADEWETLAGGALQDATRTEVCPPSPAGDAGAVTSTAGT